jgi:hypothetical protein
MFGALVWAANARVATVVADIVVADIAVAHIAEAKVAVPLLCGKSWYSPTNQPTNTGDLTA